MEKHDAERKIAGIWAIFPSLLFLPIVSKADFPIKTATQKQGGKGDGCYGKSAASNNQRKQPSKRGDRMVQMKKEILNTAKSSKM